VAAVRQALPPGALQRLLDGARSTCACGAALEPLDGYACSRCRRPSNACSNDLCPCRLPHLAWGAIHVFSTGDLCSFVELGLGHYLPVRVGNVEDLKPNTFLPRSR
jgi:hypothetical protein